MGLITSPQNVVNPGVGRLLTYSGLLSGLLMLVGGIGFTLIMPHHEFSHKTYFSENALLPGLVKNDFDQDLSAHM